MYKTNNHQETPKSDDGNGAPYDLKNKDGYHKQGTYSINSQWGPGPSQNDYPALVSSQYEPVEQSTEQASKSTIVSPIPFLYPNTVYSMQDSGNGGEDAFLKSSAEAFYCYKLIYVLPNLIQHGRSAGMPLFVRCPISNNEVKQKSVHIESRPYPCVECGEKPYKCLQCGKDFRQKAILYQHTRTH
ncbi:zinc finger protein 12-like isoform X2 [Aphis craccivora]|uniref:Zinc finger protein 12-like isoform X2 n=1 Tax=Aphis craccivora TaxID=307492 RepID=A0A6G0ZS18_APHCR|nr:zinc finger protein 12-like isoform X2 [Aphis craccivora]